MTSVDSGVETSNESNDSCVAHDTRSLDKIPPSLTHVIVTNLCTVNTASASSTSGIVDYSKEKSLSLILPDQKAPILELEPPAGISFCNLQPACGFGKGYEILGDEFASRGTKLKATTRRFCNKRYRDAWLDCKGFLEEHKLRSAASTNNVDQVADLLHSGVNPNCCDHQHRTPLHLAACRGYGSVVRLLLEYGANPNQRDALYNTPLHLAACTNHVEVVTLLLKAGTNINSNDSYGRNPLQLAQSKLKLLQRGSNNEDSLKIKEEVQKVIEMMLTFLQKKGQDSEAELLNAFQTRLTISQTKEEVETGVRDLLDSLNNLNLKSDA
ncbi:hypothetical protein R5R35_009265 [Gryllus longicercus]|uniref:Ankyrin repeat domain-containing protein 54 n=1 Tax=Gryllus longicercus TaxID=2509291 RepID=A0AAN9V876_9ORTH|nr:Transient receptor potential channel pyrexia [Gryllus bimaculatus]